MFVRGSIFVLGVGVMVALGTGCDCPCSQSDTCSLVPRAPSSHASLVRDAGRVEPVVVYYFHRTIRCVSCVRAEQWLDALLHERFAAAMAEGRLVLLILNVDEEANRHFAEEFDVQSSALWITQAVPGHTDRRTLAGEIWTRAHDKAVFDTYVGELVESYLSADVATTQKGMDR